ncbi:MAG: hypothetical protein WC045_02265 [Patescibacteria group bacterium]
MIQNRPLFIAEVKTLSPFGWKSSKTWDELFELANQHGDILSIHTDSRWGGSLDLIRTARSRTSKPILAKGIHALDKDVQEALDAGADMVLVVGRIPGIYLEKCLIEPYTVAEMQSYPANTKVVWNSRDLTTGGYKTETFEQARSIWPGWLCQASNIRTKEDVKTGADALLVGTHLEEYIAS